MKNKKNQNKQLILFSIISFICFIALVSGLVYLNTIIKNL
jgi:hypothetical protein